MLNFASFRTVCGVTLATLALTIPAASKAQTGYSIIDLGTLGGTYSMGYGINDREQVTGQSYTANNLGYRAFLYSNGSMQDIGTLGGTRTYGFSINNSGQITGRADTLPPNFYAAFVYSNGKIHDINLWQSYTSDGKSINDSGQVTGSATPL